jgi:hypothetical protein
MSVVKALEHASMRCGQKLDLQVRNVVIFFSSLSQAQRVRSDHIQQSFVHTLARLEIPHIYSLRLLL